MIIGSDISRQVSTQNHAWIPGKQYMFFASLWILCTYSLPKSTKNDQRFMYHRVSSINKADPLVGPATIKYIDLYIYLFVYLNNFKYTHI